MHPHARRCSFLKYRPDIFGRRALRVGRLGALGARRYFHHGLLFSVAFDHRSHGRNHLVSIRIGHARIERQ